MSFENAREGKDGAAGAPSGVRAGASSPMRAAEFAALRPACVPARAFIRVLVRAFAAMHGAPPPGGAP
ncbi:hypothetical protein AQ809_27025 [Burkholderia pseudomallei]|nr:hypothetical protein [Burkholderia pseudomallei]MBM5689350.1 hypothetical protein [Burkholderia pseudomallei]OMS79739.1 hypothetical protein AQ748_01150 [Burkholderia pseudomallei]OMV04230.1 hypothetical protein AQ784_29135 [Burkholderia pseudomallei]OMV04410.1 hypothetical protein AQ785_00015 [Burkholderia pseudomallei]OMW44524.1 hypothetical protein AQ809_27025 [Burkholderia pseudomallei]